MIKQNWTLKLEYPTSNFSFLELLLARSFSEFRKVLDSDSYERVINADDRRTAIKYFNDAFTSLKHRDVAIGSQSTAFSTSTDSLECLINFSKATELEEQLRTLFNFIRLTDVEVNIDVHYNSLFDPTTTMEYRNFQKILKYALT